MSSTTSDPVEAFNLRHALAEWRAQIPNEADLIMVLRAELESCRAGGTVSDGGSRGKSRSRMYPATERNIQRMLEALGS